jgi:hypothetical protein
MEKHLGVDPRSKLRMLKCANGPLIELGRPTHSARQPLCRKLDFAIIGDL